MPGLSRCASGRAHGLKTSGEGEALSHQQDPLVFRPCLQKSIHFPVTVLEVLTHGVIMWLEHVTSTQSGFPLCVEWGSEPLRSLRGRRSFWKTGEALTC